MRFVNVKAGESIATLARRIYPDLSPAARKRAEEVLAAANPHLTGGKGGPAETVVVVPASPGAAPKEGTSAGAVAAAAVRMVRENTDDLRRSLAQQADLREKRARAALEPLASAEVRKLAKATPELGRLLPNLTEAAKARLKQVDAQRKLGDEAVAELEADLDDLLRSLDRPHL
jgi:hypothetical protein